MLKSMIHFPSFILIYARCKIVVNLQFSGIYIYIFLNISEHPPIADRQEEKINFQLIQGMEDDNTFFS